MDAAGTSFLRPPESLFHDNTAGWFLLGADVQIQEHMATGRFTSEADVLRQALIALQWRESELAAVRAGVEDMDAGRHYPFAEVDAEVRSRFGFVEDR